MKPNWQITAIKDVPNSMIKKGASFPIYSQCSGGPSNRELEDFLAGMGIKIVGSWPQSFFSAKKI